jgi:hypothetical protein
MAARNVLADSGRPYPRTQVWGRGLAADANRLAHPGPLVRAGSGSRPVNRGQQRTGAVTRRPLRPHVLAYSFLTSCGGDRRSGVRVSYRSSRLLKLRAHDPLRSPVTRRGEGDRQMMVRAKLPVVVTLLVMAGSLMVGGGSASAASSIWCNKNGAAPTVGASGGVVTAYYSHVCNSVAGVTEMIQGNTIERRDVGSSDWRTWENATRDHVQTRVDFSVSKAVGGEHGYFRPVMFLAITGNFSYGSVPGCARYSGTTVYCQWFGAQKYF